MDSRFIFNVILTLWICLVKGEDYLVFYGDMQEKSSDDPIKVAYTFSSSAPNEVITRGPGSQNKDESIENGQVSLQNLPKNVIPTTGVEEGKNVLLSSQARLAVHAHMFSQKEGKGAVMAVHDLGDDSLEFIIATGNPTDDRKSHITIAAREDCAIQIFDAKSNRIKQKDLKAREIYTHQGDTDMTGFRVKSDKPVAVTSGTACSDQVSKAPPDCDPLIAYVPPVKRLGTLHIVPQVGGMNLKSEYTMRVISSADDTEVKINRGFTQVETLNAGKYVDVLFEENKPRFVECSKGCLVLMILKPFKPQTPYPGSVDETVSGPLMILVPDIWKAEVDFTFHVPAIQDAALYSLTIVTLKASRDSLMMNGNALSVNWKDIREMPLNCSGTIQLNSAAGDYRIHSTDGLVPFLLYLFVHGPESSYGGALNSFYSGLTQGFLTPTTTDQTTTPTTPSSFSLEAEDPSKPTTPTTTMSTTPEGSKITPSVKIPTVQAPDEDYDVDYKDHPDQEKFTRRPTVSTTLGPDTAAKAGSWKIGVIVAVFVVAIAAAVVIGYFLIQRSRARQREKYNSYMGQARAEFTPDGMVESKVTMGQPMPEIEPDKGKQTFRGRLKGIQQIVVSGLDTIRFPRRTTEA